MVRVGVSVSVSASASASAGGKERAKGYTVRLLPIRVVIAKTLTGRHRRGEWRERGGEGGEGRGEKETTMDAWVEKKHWVGMALGRYEEDSQSYSHSHSHSRATHSSV